MRKFVLRQISLVFLMILAFGSMDSLMALSLYSGGKTFNINVRNERYQSIYNARGNCYISGNVARIEVTADGYKSERMNVYLRENNNYYSENITLQSPRVSFKIKDSVGNYILNSSVREINAMSSDYFAFEVTVPAEGYTQFTASDVEVEASGGFLFGENVEVYDMGSSRRIRVNIRRRSLIGDFSNYITLVIPVDEGIETYRNELVKKLTFTLHCDKEENKLSDEDSKAITRRLSNLK
jgi:hypothetical protein